MMLPRPDTLGMVAEHGRAVGTSVIVNLDKIAFRRTSLLVARDPSITRPHRYVAKVRVGIREFPPLPAGVSCRYHSA